MARPRKSAEPARTEPLNAADLARKLMDYAYEVQKDDPGGPDFARFRQALQWAAAGNRCGIYWTQVLVNRDAAANAA